MKRKTGIFILLVCIMALAGCRGHSDNPVTPQHVDTQVVLKLSTSETTTLPNGTLIGAIELTLTIPAGVTVSATPDPENTTILVTETGVVVASGFSASANTLAIATYVPAQGDVPGSLRILIENADGFGTGEFVTITGDLARGGHPNASDFAVSSVTVKDQNSADVSYLVTIGHTAELK